MCALQSANFAMDAEAEWQVLGDVPFRKWECYALTWDVAIDDHVVVGAPNGGPLAVVRDDKKMVSRQAA